MKSKGDRESWNTIGKARTVSIFAGSSTNPPAPWYSGWLSHAAAHATMATLLSVLALSLTKLAWVCVCELKAQKQPKASEREGTQFCLVPSQLKEDMNKVLLLPSPLLTHNQPHPYLHKVGVLTKQRDAMQQHCRVTWLPDSAGSI